MVSEQPCVVLASEVFGDTVLGFPGWPLNHSNLRAYSDNFPNRTLQAHRIYVLQISGQIFWNNWQVIADAIKMEEGERRHLLEFLQLMNNWLIVDENIGYLAYQRV
jgi:hypothetical protein